MTSGRFLKCLQTLTLFSLMLLLAPDAEAVPRFAADMGVHCTSCHVSPTGGGARNRFGRNIYAPKVLNLGLVDDPVGVQTEVGGGDPFSAALGGDIRAAYFWQERPQDLTQDRSTFFLMQADLYLTAEMGEHLTFYFDRGMTNFEVFGFVHDARKRHWLKAGQFVMPYGLRLANHTAWVRSQTGFDPSGSYYGLDTGIEGGTSLGPVRAIAAIANGKSPTGGGGRSPFDDNVNKAIYGTVETALRGGAQNLRAGISGYYNFAGHRSVSVQDGAAQLDGDDRVKRLQGGVFVTGSAGRFVLLNEFDAIHTESHTTDPMTFEESRTEVTGIAGYHELSMRIVEGLHVKGTFEFDDPDVDAEDDRRYRAGGGLEIFPLPGLELRIDYRHTFPPEGESEFNEVLSYAHFYL